MAVDCWIFITAVAANFGAELHSCSFNVEGRFRSAASVMDKQFQYRLVARAKWAFSNSWFWQQFTIGSFDKTQVLLNLYLYTHAQVYTCNIHTHAPAHARTQTYTHKHKLNLKHAHHTHGETGAPYLPGVCTSCRPRKIQLKRVIRQRSLETVFLCLTETTVTGL